MNKQSFYLKSGLVGLMLTGLCLVSGCSVGIGFDAGPVDLFFGVYADPDVTSPEEKCFISHLQQSLQSKGYQVTALKAEHAIGFTARRRLDSNEINPVDHFLPVFDRDSSRIVLEDRRLRVRTALDLKALKTAGSHTDSALHYNLKLAFVRPPMASNADRVEKQGKELEWSFKATTAKLIEVDFAS